MIRSCFNLLRTKHRLRPDPNYNVLSKYMSEFKKSTDTPRDNLPSNHEEQKQHEIPNSSTKNNQGNSDSQKFDETNTDHKKEKKYSWTAAEAIAFSTKHYASEINKVYGDMETALMRRIKESNQRRFRFFFFSTVFGLSWVIFLFGAELRKMLSDKTADLAKETLENESLKIQTQELATAVIQTILNDKDVTSQAAKFLLEAAGARETQEALLKLTEHVLQHPDTLKQVVILLKRVINELHSDEVYCYVLLLLLLLLLKNNFIQTLFCNYTLFLKGNYQKNIHFVCIYYIR